MRKPGWIIGVIQGNHEYRINGVTYTVGSKFEPPREGRPVQRAIEHMISCDMIDLMEQADDGKIHSEYVCSAAGEED
jgi:hypothetical protein